jgi:MFS family permease
LVSVFLWRTPFRLLRNRSAAAGNAALFIIGIVGATVWSLTPLLFVKLGQGAPMIATSLAGYLLAALLSAVINPLTDRIGRTAPTVVLLLGGAAVLPWLPVLNIVGALVVSSVLLGAALSGLWTPTAAMVSDGADPSARGQAAAVALINASWAASGAVGPTIMATKAENAGFELPFALTALLCIVMAATTIALTGRNPAVKTPVSPPRP